MKSEEGDGPSLSVVHVSFLQIDELFIDCSSWSHLELSRCHKHEMQHQLMKTM